MKMKVMSMFVFLLWTSVAMAANNTSPDPSSVVRCTEDAQGYITISWDADVSSNVQYTVVISGALVETQYTNGLSVKTQNPLPKGQMISIVVGKIVRVSDDYPFDTGIYVEHARGSYVYGSTAAGPCPKKMGTMNVSYYRQKTADGGWENCFSITHLRDTDVNNAHTSFRVFIFDDAFGNPVADGYISGGSSEFLRVSGNERKTFYIKVVAASCMGESSSFDGHYFWGEMDLYNNSSGSVDLDETNI